MKKTLFINYCAYLPGEKAIKRTFYLFQMMLEQGYDVTFLTSDFNHYAKKERDTEAFYTQYPQYRSCVQFVHMKPYEKNISPKRFFCNIGCEDRILEWFAMHGEVFDAVYISFPTYRLVNRIRAYCDRYGCRLILDVNDLWPDSLRVVFKNDILYHALTCPLQKKTKQAFSYADALVAVSEEYLALASEANERASERMAVYIGAMLERFDRGVADNKEKLVKADGEFWVTYIGTLGGSYDLDTAIRAICRLRTTEKCNVRLKILGQGPTEQGLRELAASLDCNGVDFVGFQEYGVMAAYLQGSDACINCIKTRASQSVINKAADYFASGKPVLNCGPCAEMRDLIETYDAGIHYEAEDAESLAAAILTLIRDRDVAARKGQNARRLAEEKFDREKTHQTIIEMIERI